MAEEAIQPITRSCHICGGHIPSRKGGGKYCGDECRRTVDLAYKARRRIEAGAKVTGAVISCSRCGCAMEFKGRRSLYCSPCRKERRKETHADYCARNIEKRKQLFLGQRERRKDCLTYRDWQRGYMREYSRERRSDPRHRLDHRMGQLVRNGLNGTKDGRTWESLVGYSLQELFDHLERQFVKGMGWQNIDQWHVDHILPKAMFEYQSPDDEAFKACWVLTNLRPLWSGENMSKGAKRLHLI